MSSSTVIGPYKIGARTLGKGTFSKVKLAVHVHTKRKVAVKILNQEKLEELEVGSKVTREIDSLKVLQHPHVIRLYEVISTPSDIFCITEFVPGGELFDYIITAGCLQEDEARRIFQQIVSGVEYCHEHGLCHRDLKPENVLLDASNNVKIADFGLSNVMKDGFFLETSCGSPNYAAPEVINNHLYAGPEIDVWSCGVILYTMLCGTLPFDDDNISNLFRKIRGGVYTIPYNISSDARELIARMLTVDPIKRIKLCQIRTDPWFKKNLPRYLSLSVGKQVQLQSQTHADIVGHVMRMFSVNQAMVMDALARCPDLLTAKVLGSRGMELRRIAVSYYLLVDKKRDELNRQASDPVNIPEPVEETKQFVADLGLKSVGLDSKYSLSDHARRAVVKHSTWRVGKWLRTSPVLIMQLMFSVLKNLDFQWKWSPERPYIIRVRYALPADPEDSPATGPLHDSVDFASPPDTNGSGSIPMSPPFLSGASAVLSPLSPLPPGHRRRRASSVVADAHFKAVTSPVQPRRVHSVLKLRIQLYKYPNRNFYVVDVAVVRGELFLFLDTVASFLGQLKAAIVKFNAQQQRNRRAAAQLQFHMSPHRRPAPARSMGFDGGDLQTGPDARIPQATPSLFTGGPWSSGSGSAAAAAGGGGSAGGYANGPSSAAAAQQASPSGLAAEEEEELPHNLSEQLEELASQQDDASRGSLRSAARSTIGSYLSYVRGALQAVRKPAAAPSVSTDSPNSAAGHAANASSSGNSGTGGGHNKPNNNAQQNLTFRFE